MLSVAWQMSKRYVGTCQMEPAAGSTVVSTSNRRPPVSRPFEGGRIGKLA